MHSIALKLTSWWCIPCLCFTTADPVGLGLVIPDCCEDKEVVPHKKYFGGQEGVGEYIWYRLKNKLHESDLMDISEALTDVLICGKTM